MKNIIIFLLALAMTGIQAQSIFSVDEGMSVISHEEGLRLQSLMSEQHPSVYITNTDVKTYGEGAPVAAYCDGSAVSRLYEQHAAFQQVELIKINVSQAGKSTQLNLNSLQGFQSLKYIVYVYNYDVCGGKSTQCLQAMVSNLVRGNNPQVMTMYSLSIAE